jgi:methionyl-tRNA formyltransferase
MSTPISCALVTSCVTFVPENYDTAILPLLDSPHISALIVLDNFDLGLAKQILGITAFGARSIGWQLIRNSLGVSGRQRRAACKKNKKLFAEFKSINSIAALEFLQAHNINTLLNMRTRDIYKKQVLELPTFGCYNVHHGILPSQRGTLCDLWALYEGDAAGFTIHEMSSRIDDGPIVEVCILHKGAKMQYLDYLRQATKKEAEVVAGFLDNLASGQIVKKENKKDDSVVYRTTPDRTTITAMKQRGLGL